MKARHTAGEQEIEDRFSGDRFSVGEGGSLSDEGDSVASSPSGGEGGGASTAGSEVGSASGWSDAGGGGSSGGVGFGGGSVTSATGISGEGGAAPPFRPGSGLRPPPPSSSVGLSGEGGKGGGGGQHQQQPASRGSFIDRVAQSRIGASRASLSGTGVPALAKSNSHDDESRGLMNGGSGESSALSSEQGMNAHGAAAATRGGRPVRPQSARVRRSMNMGAGSSSC